MNRRKKKKQNKNKELWSHRLYSCITEDDYVRLAQYCAKTGSSYAEFIRDAMQTAHPDIIQGVYEK